MKESQILKFLELLKTVSEPEDFKIKLKEQKEFLNISFNKSQLRYALDIKDIFDGDMKSTEDKLLKDNFFADIIAPKKKNKPKPKKKIIKKENEEIQDKRIVRNIKEPNQITTPGNDKSTVIKEKEVIKMKEISDYKIERAKTEYELQQNVKRAIKLGWQPFGGVGAAAFGISPVGGNSFMQALVKYKK